MAKKTRARTSPAKPAKPRRFQVDRFRVRPGTRVRMTDYDPADSSPYRDRAEAEGQLEQELARIAELQDRLYAEDRWALLLIFQAMDGAGKDSVIKHVLRGLNPQGSHAVAFKAPVHRRSSITTTCGAA